MPVSCECWAKFDQHSMSYPVRKVLLILNAPSKSKYICQNITVNALIRTTESYINQRSQISTNQSKKKKRVYEINV